MSLRITLASRAELDASCRLLSAQLAEHGVRLGDEALRAGVQGLFDEPSRGAVLLALQDEAPVGLAILATTWTVEHGGLVAWLDELYVVPEQRGAGIGSRLLAEALATASARGCLAVELEVETAHARAAKLYQSAGFQALSRSRWALSLTPSASARQALGAAQPAALASAPVGPRPYASLDHLSLGVNDLARSKAFYDAALAPLGLVAYETVPGELGYGPPGGAPKQGFALYIGFEEPALRRQVAPSAGFHVALHAPSRDAVRAFHRAALEAGGLDLGAPGLRPHYHEDYYGAFVADPDGHHVEAVCHAAAAG